MIALVVTLLVVWAVISVFIALHQWLHWTYAVQQQLVTSLHTSSVHTSEAPVQKERLLIQPLNRQLRQLSFGSELERRLAASHTNLTVTEFLTAQIGVALLGLLIGWFLSGRVVSGLVLAGLCWMLPRILLRQRQSMLSKKFAAQLPDMLSLLVGSLRAGYGLLHALRVIQQEMPEPMASEFDQVLKETMLGYSIGEALDHLVERMENEDLDLVVTSIHIQNEVGGSLAEVLDTISVTIRERIKVIGEIRTMTSQQRMTGWMMTLMPFGLASLMMLANPDYMLGMFQVGWTIIIPIGAVVMIILGNIAMRLMVKIEV